MASRNETEVDLGRGDDGRPIVSDVTSPARSSFFAEATTAKAECHGVPDSVTQARGLERRVDELIACVADGLLGERLIPLNDAARLLRRPNGRQPSKVTTWRWATKGIRGVVGRYARLETLKIGLTRYTSYEAINRFAAALDARADGGAPPAQAARRPAHRRAAMAAATAELRKAGFM